MAVFPSWPWTNFHEENLDWVIKTVKECKETVAEALADVSNAVAMYFADHLDTTLTRSGEAADAAAVGNRLGQLSNNISNVQTTLSDDILSVRASIPDLDVTLTSPQAAAPAATVGSRLTYLQNELTNIQTNVSVKTYDIEFDINQQNPSATLTPHAGELVVDTCLKLERDLAAGYGAFINVHRFNSVAPSSQYYDIAYGIYLEKHNDRVLFETHDYSFVMLRSGGNVVITYTAK